MTARERAERLLTDLIQLVATDGGYFNDTERARAVAMAALADERRRGMEEAAKAVLQTTIKLDVDWMRTATKAETIAETLRQASAALSAQAHAGQEG